MAQYSTPYEENGGIPTQNKNFEAPGAHSLGVGSNVSGYLGDDFGDDLFCVPGNPDRSILGGDNRTDLGLHTVAGNPPAGSTFSRQYDWPGDSPLFAVEHNTTPDTLKSMFRGGSDALTFDGRDNGS